MLALLNRCFEGVRQDTFEADLADKSHAVLVRDGGGGLVGFSTLALWQVDDPAGRPATVVCSGDTIVVPEAWGSWALPRHWVRAVHDLHRREGRGELYWLLICSGFRTFRFLPVFMRRYVVAAEATADADPSGVRLRRWARQLARQRWGPQFDPAAGVVRLRHPQRLRPGLIDVPPGRAQQQQVQRFLQLNPGHSRGDELVCLARLSPDDLTPAGRRMLGEPAREARP